MLLFVLLSACYLSSTHLLQDSSMFHSSSYRSLRFLLSLDSTPLVHWSGCIGTPFPKISRSNYFRPVSCIFNLSLPAGVFPRTGSSTVIPLFKGSESSEVYCYRPITILPSRSTDSSCTISSFIILFICFSVASDMDIVASLLHSKSFMTSSVPFTTHSTV